MCVHVMYFSVFMNKVHSVSVIDHKSGYRKYSVNIVLRMSDDHVTMVPCQVKS